MINDRTKIRVLFALILISLLFTLFLIINLQLLPTKSNLSPQNYFNKNILWNVSILEFKDLMVFQMQNTSSMLPTIPYNSIVLAVPNDKMGQVKVGDIIAFYLPEINSTVAHRIIKVEGEKYLTKGDNMKTETYWIKRDKIIGRIVGVLY